MRNAMNTNSVALVPANVGHFGTKDSSTAAPVAIASCLIGQRLDQLFGTAAHAQYRRASLNSYRRVARQTIRHMPQGSLESLSA